MDYPKQTPTTSIHQLLLSSGFLYLLLPTCLLLICIKRRYFSPLKGYPGPPLASITPLWKVRMIASGQGHLGFINLHKKYGPIVRIAPNELSLSSPEAARELLSAGKGFHKTNFYWVFPAPGSPDIFTEIRENVHAQKRRVVNGPYSMATMQQMAPIMNGTIDSFFAKLDSFCQSPKSFDFGAWLHYFAFDVLGEVAFSRRFGFLDEGRDIDGTIKAIDDSQWYNGLVGQIPWLDYVFRRNPLKPYIPFLGSGSGLITRIALSEVAKRKPFEDNENEQQARPDLLGALVRGHLKDPTKFGEGDVFSAAHGAIFAGADSTASTMQSFFHHILKEPRIYEKLCAEVLDASRDGRLSDNVQWSEAQQLPYFQACLKETFRARPAVGLNICRLIPKGGAEVDGTYYPEGTEMAMNSWVLHRDAGIFGDDVEAFYPERWLKNEEQSKMMERHLFHFGGGSHVCIGRNLALLEINKVLPRLLRRYKFSLQHASQELKVNVTFFVVQEGLNVHIERRESY